MGHRTVNIIYRIEEQGNIITLCVQGINPCCLLNVIPDQVGGMVYLCNMFFVQGVTFKIRKTFNNFPFFELNTAKKPGTKRALQEGLKLGLHMNVPVQEILVLRLA